MRYTFVAGSTSQEWGSHPRPSLNIFAKESIPYLSRPLQTGLELALLHFRHVKFRRLVVGTSTDVSYHAYATSAGHYCHILNYSLWNTRLRMASL